MNQITSALSKKFDCYPDRLLAPIHFEAVIQSAFLESGLGGNLIPVFASQYVSGVIGENSLGQFYASLQFSPFIVGFRNCGSPDSECSNYSSNGLFSVTDDNEYINYHFHTFTDNQSGIDFDVFNSEEGEIIGHIDHSIRNGVVTAALNGQSAFRADNHAELVVTLSVLPLPASLPMFGCALLALGALAYRKRLRGAP